MSAPNRSHTSLLPLVLASQHQCGNGIWTLFEHQVGPSSRTNATAMAQIEKAQIVGSCWFPRKEHIEQKINRKRWK